MSSTLFASRSYEIELKSVQGNGNGTWNIKDVTREELIEWMEKHDIHSVEGVVAYAKRRSRRVEGKNDWQKACFFFDNFFPPKAALVFAGLCGVEMGFGPEWGKWETGFISIDA